MKQKIFIAIGIILAVWLIWFLFFRKTTAQKIVGAVANRDCNYIKNNISLMKRGADKNTWTDSTDKQLTDFLYSWVSDWHKIGMFNEIQLTGNLTREEKINNLVKIYSYLANDYVKEVCKA